MSYVELPREMRLSLTQRRLLPSVLVVTYIFAGYLAGLEGILLRSPLWNVVGVLLLVHSLVLSGLLSHELIHRAVFRSRLANDLLATLVSVINGACYVPFSLLRRQHMAHHVDKVGYDGFSVSDWMCSLPRPIQSTLRALEYCYIPILTLIASSRLMVYPFFNAKYRRLRARVALVFCLRMAFFGALFWIRPAALLLYFVAYLGVITVFRVFDCFHHTFQVVALGSPLPRMAPGYEQDNTYSSLLSRRRAWLNAIFLNYGYHNAHHALPSAPWYQLPRIDRAMFGESEGHCLILKDFLAAYHRHRLRRIDRGMGRPTRRDGKLDASEFYGIIMNLSFMDYDYNDL